MTGHIPLKRLPRHANDKQLTELIAILVYWRAFE